MPVNEQAPIEITAFRWVPPFAAGLVRDLRARWALEEAGLDYRVRLLDQERPADYLLEQPFDQVPCFKDGKVAIFETGAIVQYVGEQSETLLPRDPQGRYRAIQWTYAALNSVEPAILNLLAHRHFLRRRGMGEAAPAGRRGFRQAEAQARVRLARRQGVARRDRFTIGDLMMVTVLRNLRHTDLVAGFANLAAYVERGEARPAFQRALAAQLAVFKENEPALQPARAEPKKERGK